MAQHKDTSSAPQTALVVFSGNSDLPYLKLLKPGFRHCFIILQQGDLWITCNALSHYTRLEAFTGLSVDEVTAGLQHLHHTVLQTSTQIPPAQLAPIGIYSCVEAVKRILGLQIWYVVTPWQLYNYLLK